MARYNLDGTFKRESKFCFLDGMRPEEITFGHTLCQCSECKTELKNLHPDK